MTDSHRTVPAGWYPDPENPRSLRYWDGAAWSEHRRAIEAGEEASVEVVSPLPLPAPPIDDFPRLIERVLGDYRVAVIENEIRREAQIHAFLVSHTAKVEPSAIDWVRHRIHETRVATGVPYPVYAGQVAPELLTNARKKALGLSRYKPSEPIVVFSDRIVQGEAAYPIDGYTQAQVYLDGQTQITTRPTLTRMALLSSLPGSTLAAGLATAKRTVHDLRIAEFQVGSTTWAITILVSPWDVSGPRMMANRINQIAAATQDRAQSPSRAAAGVPLDIVSQIERIVALEAAGSITAVEAAQMRSRVIGTA